MVRNEKTKLPIEKRQYPSVKKELCSVVFWNQAKKIAWFSY